MINGFRLAEKSVYDCEGFVKSKGEAVRMMMLRAQWKFAGGERSGIERITRRYLRKRQRHTSKRLSAIELFAYGRELSISRITTNSSYELL